MWLWGCSNGLNFSFSAFQNYKLIMYWNATIWYLSDFGIHLYVMLQIIFGGTYGVTSMQISNRANGHYPEDELNKVVQLSFSDGYTTNVSSSNEMLPPGSTEPLDLWFQVHHSSFWTNFMFTFKIETWNQGPGAQCLPAVNFCQWNFLFLCNNASDANAASFYRFCRS